MAAKQERRQSHKTNTPKIVNSWGLRILMAEEDIYTKDGTTDFRNKPAIKNETGTWKACPYILGIISQVYIIF